MEAGERWMLNDVTGKPIRAWNSRKYVFSTKYDTFRRPCSRSSRAEILRSPTPRFFRSPSSLSAHLWRQRRHGADRRSAATGQSETQGLKAFRRRGRRHHRLYDFKGNSLRGARQFVNDYKNAPDWSQSPALDSETFATATAYDALNRPAAVTTPDNSVYRPAFNEAALLGKVDVNLRGASATTSFVTSIDYNARGQRTLIEYGNGAKTQYSYDPGPSGSPSSRRPVRRARRGRRRRYLPIRPSCRICAMPTIPPATSPASPTPPSSLSSTANRSTLLATIPMIRSTG